MNDSLLDVPIIAILRGVQADFFADLMPVSFAAGLQALEVTMNTVGVEKMIAQNLAAVPPGCLLGAGTVCNIEDAKRAVGAGAMFLVAPNTDKEVIEYGRSQNIPVAAGALTPTEVFRAWSYGADLVKVFPCGLLGGPQYIKALRGPYDTIPLLAVGGVSIDNILAYFKAGVKAVGVGESFFGIEALHDKNINELTKNVKNYMHASLACLGNVVLDKSTDS